MNKEIKITTTFIEPKVSPNDAYNDKNFVIDTQGELNDFIKKHNNMYDFSNFNSSEYTKDFFVDNFLVLYFVITGSSANYMVKNVKNSGQNKEITIAIDKPFLTMDISFKLAVIEILKNDINSKRVIVKTS